MEALSNRIVQNKWLVIALIAVLTAFFAYQFKYLEVDSNVVDALPESDPIVKMFNDVGERFGSNQIGLIVVEADNVFQPATLDRIQQVTDTLAEIEGVVSVTSITNMMSFRSEGDDFEVDNLISRRHWPQTQSDVDSLKEAVTSNEMVAGTLVAEDGSSTIVLFYFQSDSDIKSVASEVVSKLEGLNLPENLYYAGSTFLTSYVANIISTDMMKLIPISFLLIALILFLSFRSIRGVILPLLSAGLAIVWAIGTFVLFGFKLSMVSNNVPIIILTVGSAYAIHVFNRIHQSKATDRRQAIIGALRYVAMPVTLSGLTTVVGFTSFVFGAYLSMIRDFGILAAIGTFYSVILALFLVPALLALLPIEKRDESASGSDNSDSFIKTRILIPLYKMAVNHPKRVIGFWVVLVIAGIAGTLMVKRSVSVADYFKKHHPASVADRIMEARYGGSKPVYVVFKGDVQSPELLTGMKNFGDYLLASPYVTSTQSIADVVIKLNNALSEEKGIPDEKTTIQQLWFFLGQQDLSQLITEDLDQALIMAKFNNDGQANIGKFNKYVDEYLAANSSDDYTIEISGMPYVNTQLDKSLVKSQITSLLLAVVLVIILVSLIFKSAVEGVFASTPIIATITILYGFMGFVGIPLNVVTVLVASVAMGIGIDYSIHFVTNFNLSYDQSGDTITAIEAAVMTSGKAIFINFISVSAGFLVLAFSDLMPMVYFGVLIALSMLGSAMGALTLLPSILYLSRPDSKTPN